MNVRPSRTSIGKLFFSSGPAAIPWLVISVIVDSVYGQQWRRVAHVVIEILKVVPSFAYRNSARTITSVAHFIGILATLNNPLPTAIYPTTRFAVSYDGIQEQASTTSGVSRFKLCAIHFYLFTAFAKTKPRKVETIASPAEVAQYGQSPERFASQVDEFFTGWQAFHLGQFYCNG